MQTISGAYAKPAGDRRGAISPDCDIRLIIGAMAEQAAKQAQRGDKHAALWLATDGVFMLDAAGMETAAFELGNLARAVLWKHPRAKATRK